MLGKITVDNYIEEYKNDNDYEKFKNISNKGNFKFLYPLIEENYKCICELKEQGYNLYLLTNITNEGIYELIIKNIF